MTLDQLERMVTRLVNQGHGNKELRMDTDPEVEFDIEFIEYRKDEEGEPYIGVRTNDNH